MDGYKLSSESYMKMANLNHQMFSTAMKHMPDLNPPELSWYETPEATFIYGMIAGGIVVFSTTYLATKALDSSN